MVPVCFSRFFQLSLGWPDFCGGGGNRTSLTLNPDLVCFLLGEIVGFLPPPPLPPPGSSSILPSPLQGTLRNLSHLLLRDGAGVCVWNTEEVFSNSTLDCSGVGLYNFKECLDFPASCGLLLSYCTDCNIMLHVQDEQ